MRKHLTLGVSFRPQLPPEKLVEMAVAADRSALDEFWLWEDCFDESGVAAAAACLARTNRVRIGLGVMPAPLRNVALTAMEIATLSRLFPDRFSAGVGHGDQAWMQQAGAKVASPMTLLREYVQTLRRLLDGETVTIEGRYVQLDEVRLGWPPKQPVPLLVAAEGPKTLELAGELGDGTVLAPGTDVAMAQRARERIAAGRARSTSPSSSHTTMLYLPCARQPNDEAIEAERKFWRFPPERDYIAAGDARSVALAAHRWIDAGVDRLIFVPVVGDDDVAGFVRFIDEQVRPLLVLHEDGPT